MLLQKFGHIKKRVGRAQPMSDSDPPSWPDDEDPFSSIDENSSEEKDVAPSIHQEDETYGAVVEIE